MEVVFADVVQVPQVGAGVTASLRRADGVEAGVTAQLGQAGATVARPDALCPRPCTWSIERTSSLVLGARGREEDRSYTQKDNERS